MEEAEAEVGSPQMHPSQSGSHQLNSTEQGQADPRRRTVGALTWILFVSGTSLLRGHLSTPPDHLSALDHDYDIPGAGAGIAPEKASALLSQFERRRLAATIAVPTDDGRVRAKLREMGEPVTLFGEGPADRRDRLRGLLAEEAQKGSQDKADVEMKDAVDEGEEAEDQEEEFYSRGSDELLQARIDIARYSVPRAKQRIEFQ